MFIIKLFLYVYIKLFCRDADVVCGKFFVYVENSDGVIEKRFVKTKNGIEYSYAFVTSGLSMDDYIAMAYGNVKEGMPVKRVSYQELQGGILGDLF